MISCSDLPENTDWVGTAQGVIDIEIQGLVHVRDKFGPDFVSALTLLGQCSGRVVVTGIGKSGLVGRKLAATFSSTGTPSFFLHPVEGAHGDMGMIRSTDVVLAISNSGETDELNAILPSLKSLGASIIAMTGRKDSTMGRLADAVIDTGVPKEACSLNLAPTASTTACLAVGDALAVCLMNWKSFDEKDFLRFHPGGSLGQRLSACIQHFMHSDNIPRVDEDTTLEQGMSTLNSGGLGAVIITDEENHLTGILTDGDIRRMVVEGTLDLETPIAEVMIDTPRIARPFETVGQLIDRMEQSQITLVPVVDDDHHLLGVIHLHDLLGKGKVHFTK